MPRPSKTIYRDDDDRPRRQPDSDGPPVLVIVLGAIGALVVVAAVGTVGWFLIGHSTPAPQQAGPAHVAEPETAPARKAPKGWTDVRDTEGGYQVFLPGTLTKGQPQLAGPIPQGVQMTFFAGPGDKITATARSIKPAGPIPPKTTPEQMLGWLPSWNIGTDKNTEVESQTPVTLGGKPGLLVRVVEKRKDYAKLLKPGAGGQIPEANANDPQELKDALDLIKEYQKASEEAKQQALKEMQDKENARPLRHELYFVTSNGQRVIVLHLKQTGEYPDEGTLTTLTGSFEFL
jgi:hypothetical protein